MFVYKVKQAFGGSWPGSLIYIYIYIYFLLCVKEICK